MKRLPRKTQDEFLSPISVGEQGMVPCQTYLSHCSATDDIYKGRREGSPVHGMCYDQNNESTVLLDVNYIRVFKGCDDEKKHVRDIHFYAECKSTPNGLHFFESEGVYLIVQRSRRNPMPLLQLLTDDFEHSSVFVLKANHICSSEVTWSSFAPTRNELIVGFSNGEILAWQLRRHSSKVLDFRVPLRVRFSSVNRLLKKDVSRLVSDIQVLPVLLKGTRGKSSIVPTSSRQLLLGVVGFYLFVWEIETGRMIAGWDSLSELPKLLPETAGTDATPVGVLHVVPVPSAGVIIMSVGNIAQLFVFQFDTTDPQSTKLLSSVPMGDTIASMYTLSASVGSNLLVTTHTNATWSLWTVTDTKLTRVSASLIPGMTSATPHLSLSSQIDISSPAPATTANQELVSSNENEKATPRSADYVGSFKFDLQNRYYGCFFVDIVRNRTVCLLCASTWVLQIDILVPAHSIASTWSRRLPAALAPPPPEQWVCSQGHKRRTEFTFELEGPQSMAFLSRCLGWAIPPDLTAPSAGVSVGASLAKTTVTVYQGCGLESEQVYVAVMDGSGHCVGTGRLPNHSKFVNMDFRQWAPSVEPGQLPPPVRITAAGGGVVAGEATVVVGWEDGKVDSISISSFVTSADAIQRIDSCVVGKAAVTSLLLLGCTEDKMSDCLVFVGRDDGRVNIWELCQFDAVLHQQEPVHCKGFPIIAMDVIPARPKESIPTGQGRVVLVSLDGQVKTYVVQVHNSQVKLQVDGYFHFQSEQGQDYVPSRGGLHLVSSSAIVQGLKQTTIALTNCAGLLQVWTVPPGGKVNSQGRKRENKLLVVRSPLCSSSEGHGSPIVHVQSCESDRFYEFRERSASSRFYSVLLLTASIDSSVVLWDCSGRTAASTKLVPIKRFQFNTVPFRASFLPLLRPQEVTSQPLNIAVSFGSNHGSFLVKWNAGEARKTMKVQTFKFDHLRPRPPSTSGTVSEKKLLNTFLRYYNRYEVPRVNLFRIASTFTSIESTPFVEGIQPFFEQYHCDYDVDLHPKKVGLPTPMVHLLEYGEFSDFSGQTQDEVAENSEVEFIEIPKHCVSVLQIAMQLASEGIHQVVSATSLEADAGGASQNVINGIKKPVGRNNQGEKIKDKNKPKQQELREKSNKDNVVTVPRPWTSASSDSKNATEKPVSLDDLILDDPFAMKGVVDTFETTIGSSRVQLKHKVAHIDGSSSPISELDKDYLASVGATPVDRMNLSQPSNTNKKVLSPTRKRFHLDNSLGPVSSGVHHAVPIGFSDRLKYEKILFKGKHQKRKLNMDWSEVESKKQETMLDAQLKKSMWRLRRKLHSPNKSRRSIRTKSFASGWSSDSSLYSSSRSLWYDSDTSGSYDDESSWWSSEGSYYSSSDESYSSESLSSDESLSSSSASISAEEDGTPQRNSVVMERRMAREKRDAERAERRKLRRQRRHKRKHRRDSETGEDGEDELEKAVTKEEKIKNVEGGTKRSKYRSRRRKRKHVVVDDPLNDNDPNIGSKPRRRRRRKRSKSRSSRRTRRKERVQKREEVSTDWENPEDESDDEARRNLSYYRLARNWQEVWFYAATIIVEELEKFEVRPRTRRRAVPLSRAEQWHSSYAKRRKQQRRKRRGARRTIRKPELGGFSVGGKAIFSPVGVDGKQRQLGSSNDLMELARRHQALKGWGQDDDSRTVGTDRPPSAMSRTSKESKEASGMSTPGRSSPNSSRKSGSAQSSQRPRTGTSHQTASTLEDGTLRRINLEEVMEWYEPHELVEDDGKMRESEEKAFAVLQEEQQKLDDTKWFAMKEFEPSAYDEPIESLKIQVVLALSFPHIWQVAKSQGLLRPCPRDHLSQNSKVERNLEDCIQWWLRESVRDFRSAYYVIEAKAAIESTIVKRTLYNMTGRAYASIDASDAESNNRRKRQIWRDFRTDYFSQAFQTRRLQFLMKERDRLAFAWLQPSIQWKVWLRADVKQRPEKYDGYIDPSKLDQYKRVIIRKELEQDREKVLTRERDESQEESEMSVLSFNWKMSPEGGEAEGTAEQKDAAENEEDKWNDSVQVALATMPESLWPTGYSLETDIALADVEDSDVDSEDSVGALELDERSDAAESDGNDSIVEDDGNDASTEGDSDGYSDSDSSVEEAPPPRQSQAFVRKAVDPDTSAFYENLLSFHFELTAFRAVPSCIDRAQKFDQEWGKGMNWLEMSSAHRRTELEAACCDRIVRQQANSCLVEVPEIQTLGDEAKPSVDETLSDHQRWKLSEKREREKRRQEREWDLFGLWYAASTIIREGFLVREMRSALGDKFVMQQAIRSSTFDDEASRDDIAVPKAGQTRGEEVSRFETWAMAKWMKKYIQFHTSPDATESFDPSHKRRVSKMLMEDARKFSQRISTFNEPDEKMEMAAEQILMNVSEWQNTDEVRQFVSSDIVLSSTEVKEVKQRRLTRQHSRLSDQLHMIQLRQLEKLLDSFDARNEEYKEARSMFRKSVIAYQRALMVAETDEKELVTYVEGVLKNKREQLKVSTEAEMSRIDWEEVTALEALDHDFEDAMEQAKESHEEAQYEAQVMFDMKVNKAGTKAMLMAATKRGKAELIASERREKEENRAKMVYDESKSQVANKYDLERKKVREVMDTSIAETEARMKKAMFEFAENKSKLYSQGRLLTESLLLLALVAKKKYEEVLQMKSMASNGTTPAESLECIAEWVNDEDLNDFISLVLEEDKEASTLEAREPLSAHDMVETQLVSHEAHTPSSHWDTLEARVHRSMYMNSISTFLGTLAESNQEDNEKMFAEFGREGNSLQIRKLQEFMGEAPTKYLSQSLTNATAQVFLRKGCFTVQPAVDKEGESPVARHGMKLHLDEPEKPKEEASLAAEEPEQPCDQFKQWYIASNNGIRKTFLSARVTKYKAFLTEMHLRGESRAIQDACLFDDEAIQIPPEDESVRRRKYYKQVLLWYTNRQLREDDLRMQQAEKRGRLLQQREIQQQNQRELVLMREHLREHLQADEAENQHIELVWKGEADPEEDDEPHTFVFVKNLRRESVEFIQRSHWAHGDGTLNQDEMVDAEREAKDRELREKLEVEQGRQEELRLMRLEESLMKRWLVEQRRIRLNATKAQEMNRQVYAMREEERQRRRDPGGMTIEQRRLWEMGEMAKEEQRTRKYLADLVALRLRQQQEARELALMRGEDGLSLAMMQRARAHEATVQQHLEAARLREIGLMSFQDECSLWMSRKWEKQRQEKLRRQAELDALAQVAFARFDPAHENLEEEMLLAEVEEVEVPKPLTFTRSFLVGKEEGLLEAFSFSGHSAALSSPRSVLPKALEYEIHLSKQFHRVLDIPRPDVTYTRNYNDVTPRVSPKSTARTARSRASPKNTARTARSRTSRPSSANSQRDAPAAALAQAPELSTVREGSHESERIVQHGPEFLEEETLVVESFHLNSNSKFRLAPLDSPAGGKHGNIAKTPTPTNYVKSQLIPINVKGLRKPMRPSSRERRLAPVGNQ